MTTTTATHSRSVAYWLEELQNFVRIPNNVFEPLQIQQNAQYLQALLKGEGFSVQLWNTPTGKPYVFAEYHTDPHLPTILFYSHYDGVPVDEQRWAIQPYQAVLKNNAGKLSSIQMALAQPGTHRIYGRSIADSKNALISILAALSFLKEKGQKPGVNIKLLLDGEEEQESPFLKSTVLQHRKEIGADLVISASGETHQSGRPTIAFGVRGILILDITVYTATTDMHSGHFGNFTPNAALELSNLLSLLKNRMGQVLIPGFYQGTKSLTPAEQMAIADIPPVEDSIQKQFGIGRPEQNHSLASLINLPTFNIRGMQAGYVGQGASNIIPSKAQASIDCRLVEGMDPEQLYRAIVQYLEQNGYRLCCAAPSLEDLYSNGTLICVEKKGSFKAVKTNMETGLPNRVLKIVQSSTHEPWVVEPTEGGSLNFEVFGELDIPLITLPVSNFDCNQHSHNENLRVDFFIRGIEVLKALLAFKESVIKS